MSDIPMSDAECALSMKRLEPRQRLYAQLLVRNGVNIQPDQELVVSAPVEAASCIARTTMLANWRMPRFVGCVPSSES